MYANFFPLPEPSNCITVILCHLFAKLVEMCLNCTTVNIGLEISGAKVNLILELNLKKTKPNFSTS